MRIPTVLPPPALPGDRVGVAALSGPVDGEKLDRGLTALADLGFEPVPADNLRSRHGLFAGGDEERLDAFHRLAADPSLRAIFFARGGWGALRLLPRLDWDLLAARPRAYVGYSDLTPFLIEVVRRLGLAAFHGPMVAADLARGLGEDEEVSLLDALAGRYPAALELPGWGREGEAEGVLLGGCLSLLTATLGTPYAPPLEHALLFWEETCEPLYRIDRMLTHLRLSGNLANIAGMIVGHVDGVAGERDLGIGWRELAVEITAEDRHPLAWGLSCGHSRPNLTLPLGMGARMEPAARRLVVGLTPNAWDR